MRTARKLSSYSRGEIALLILKCCLLGVAIGSILVCPNLAQLYKYFDAQTKNERKRVRNNVLKLQRLGYLIDVDSDTQQLRPTAKGVRQAEYDSLLIQRQKRWDQQWRLCMFDIPEEHKRKRRIFSAKIAEMGMRHYQKSVYVSPFPCETELQKVALHLKVKQYVRLVTASDISDAAAYQKQFGL